MSEPTWIIANNAEVPQKYQRSTRSGAIRLRTFGANRNVDLDVETFVRPTAQNLTPLQHDLLEIVAIVHAADLQVLRGNPDSLDYAENWKRDFHFVIPVRLPELWMGAAVHQALCRLLTFLTEDQYTFHFVPQPDYRPLVQQHCTSGLPLEPGQDVEDVLLFSGGIDSLAGAIQEIILSQKRIALVSHRSNNISYARQQELYSQLRQRCPNQQRLPIQITLPLSLRRHQGVEGTQRSRSFIFASAAAIVAQHFERQRIRFAENGITSLNLPICLQVLGARASRTTHPRTLALFQDFFSKLFNTSFQVENLGLWFTKTELVCQMISAGHGDLVAKSRSCVRTRIHEEDHPHCGVCSQCVDRRLSCIAAGLESAQEPKTGYQSEVLTGARAGSDLTMVERFVANAREFQRFDNPISSLSQWGQLPEILASLPGDRTQNTQRIVDLLRRQGECISSLLKELVSVHSDRVARLSYPANSLLGCITGRVNGAVTAMSETTHSPGQFDEGKRILYYQQRECEFKKELEFRLFRYLFRHLGSSLPIQEIAKTVWNNPSTDSRTIQQAISRLRKTLRSCSMDQFIISGERRGHYGLKLRTEQTTSA